MDTDWLSDDELAKARIGALVGPDDATPASALQGEPSVDWTLVTRETMTSWSLYVLSKTWKIKIGRWLLDITSLSFPGQDWQLKHLSRTPSWSRVNSWQNLVKKTKSTSHFGLPSLPSAHAARLKPLPTHATWLKPPRPCYSVKVPPTHATRLKLSIRKQSRMFVGTNLNFTSNSNTQKPRASCAKGRREIPARAVVLNRRDTPPQGGGVNKFPGRASLYALCNKESFWTGKFSVNSLT